MAHASGDQQAHHRGRSHTHDPRALTRRAGAPGDCPSASLTGLPTETDEDTAGHHAHLAKRVVDVGRRHRQGASCTVSVGELLPKPHAGISSGSVRSSVPELRRKVNLLRDGVRRTKAQIKWHDPEATFAKGSHSAPGDHRLGPVIEQVWQTKERSRVERALRASAVARCSEAAKGLD